MTMIKKIDWEKRLFLCFVFFFCVLCLFVCFVLFFLLRATETVKCHMFHDHDLKRNWGKGSFFVFCFLDSPLLEKPEESIRNETRDTEVNLYAILHTLIHTLCLSKYATLPINIDCRRKKPPKFVPLKLEIWS